ncbi:alpha/beta hydrolase [Egibacter rhizosphaerae]|uniref:Alpha/beta hydrolase n=1 Tax=Egibacter rhizosphaerae TaxID=1670831 RepID=A0A411YLE5_9ACTN|nr:alpha/beta hydrolase [Egibacter rhizosphaerae]
MVLVHGQTGDGDLDWAALLPHLTDRFTCYLPANDEEMATLEAAGYVEDVATYAPTLLQEIQLESQPEAFSPTSPAALAEITAPVLLLHGSRTPLRWFTDAVGHVAAHTAESEVREIAGAGHGAPVIEPHAVAEELIGFLASSPAAGPPHAAAVRA